MNNAFIFSIGMGLGAGVGIVGTYFYMKKRIEKAVEETINDYKTNYHAKSLGELYTGDKNDISEKAEEIKESVVVDEVFNGGNLNVEHSSMASEPVEIEKTSYSNMYVKPDIDELLNAEDVFAQNEHPEDGGEEDIRLIDISEYEELAYGDDDYSYSTLAWYMGDDSLVDDNGFEIEDIEPIIGDVLDNIDVDDITGVDKKIYIRNDILEMVYQIECVEANFVDMIE